VSRVRRQAAVVLMKSMMKMWTRDGACDV